MLFKLTTSISCLFFDDFLATGDTCELVCVVFDDPDDDETFADPWTGEVGAAACDEDDDPNRSEKLLIEKKRS